ncbi:MAG TPA: cell division protein FtsQ/DivIB [Beijerinckiaceae bacterium]|jgi:cell division protein FtsQ
MDGGGRYLRPVTAGAYGPGAASSVFAPFFGDRPLLSRFSLRSPLRRRSVAVPVAHRLPRLLGTGLVALFFAGVGTTGAIYGGHYQDFRQVYGEPYNALARLVGLGVERVTIAGVAQLTEREVLQAAGITTTGSLPFLDAADARTRLERIPLVKSASVRKIFPQDVVVTLTEREPHALWQRGGELFVIAADGTVIDLMQDARFATLPLVVGDEANARTRDYLALLEAAGPLKGRIRAGTLVSGRRWTLKMDNGVDVRLPELGAAEALARLVKLEREQKILGRDLIAIDLRMPDRVVVRLTEEAASARAEAVKKKPTRGKGIET